jgi:subtilisin family serine protease
LVKTEGYTDQIVDALAWITETAASLGQAVSVNVSLGSHYGAHDGSRADELAIDAVSGSGAIVACAAGNSDAFPIHARGTVPVSGAMDSLVLAVGDYPQTGVAEGFGLDFWYPGGCSLQVALRDPLGVLHGPVSMGDTLSEDGPAGVIWLANDVDMPLNGDHHAVVLATDEGMADSVCTGSWVMTIEGSGRGVWHGWLFLRSHGATALNSPDSTCTLVMPATAESCITVGGYGRDDGNAYSFSSRGPTRDGRQRPDLCAPTFVTTPTPGGGYALFGGTSASAPHVAGAVAMALGRNAGLGPACLRTILHTSARIDDPVMLAGLPPSDKWGFGKLYVEPLVRSFSIDAISIAHDTTFSLTWTVAAGAQTYEVYRDSTAFFDPDTTGFSNRAAVLQATDDAGTGDGFQWTDPADVPLVAVDRFVAYVVRALKDEESWWSGNRCGALSRAAGDRRMR